ncbi:response regulator [Glaciecola sp. 1036]|uniref:response regulator n=1 Tax=Alteromonadaceae TaxID=72275 RepID=UPI003CFCB20A
MEKLNYSEKRCLVIEDRRPFLMLLRGLLTSLGAKKITTESSAEAGLKACKANKYDIIVSDLHLGSNKKNGFEFLEELRKHQLIKPSTVFIMISAESGRSMVLGSIEKQPDDYLIKPFSQAQLNARIARASVRRATLSALYSQIDHQKYELAIQTCRHFLDTEPRYTAHLLKLLVSLYWKLDQFEAAESILTKILNDRPMLWATCAMAKTKLYLKQYDEAIEIGKKVIQQSVNTVEAYDIVADAYLASDRKPEALKYIIDALAISPLSIDRHFNVCRIARENQDFELAMSSAKSIFELSQRSIHKNVNHMCGYVRSILDVAEHTTDKKVKNRFMQETSLTMQRMQRNEEFAGGKQDDFDFEIFESLIQARMQLLEGKQTEAKRTLEETQINIEKEFTEYPLPMATDSLKLMIDMGDYEEANKLVKLLGDNADKTDLAIRHLIESELENAKSKRIAYVRSNKKGIALYSQGNFSEAYQEFTTAKQICPLNISVNLNLLQSLIRLVKSTEKPEGRHIQEVREIFRFISSMPLKEIHKQKFQNMHKDAEEIIN